MICPVRWQFHLHGFSFTQGVMIWLLSFSIYPLLKDAKNRGENQECCLRNGATSPLRFSVADTHTYTPIYLEGNECFPVWMLSSVHCHWHLSACTSLENGDLMYSSGEGFGTVLVPAVTSANQHYHGIISLWFERDESHGCGSKYAECQSILHPSRAEHTSQTTTAEMKQITFSKYHRPPWFRLHDIYLCKRQKLVLKPLGYLLVIKSTWFIRRLRCPPFHHLNEPVCVKQQCSDPSPLFPTLYYNQLCIWVIPSKQIKSAAML